MTSATTENVEAIVNQYLPKIRYYAYKLSINLPSELSHDDLVSAGVIGLLEAMQRYDSKREASLKTFSDWRIRGAIIDEIRSMQWVSRDMRKKFNVVTETYKNLENKLSRLPLDKEVAEELGMSVNMLNRVLMTNTINHLLSLYDVVISKYGEVKEIIDCISSNKEANPSELFELKESRKRLAAAIKKLTQKERLVLTLYYYEELTQKEIGALIGLTESRICQLLNKIICKLRENMNQRIRFKEI